MSAPQATGAQSAPRPKPRVTVKIEDGVTSALCKTVQHFAKKEIDAELIDREAKIPPRVLSGLAELGLFGISLPEAYGGADLPLKEVCAVVATLAQTDRSVATTVGLHAGLGTRGLVRFGSDALKAQYLPPMASGASIAAFAATEAGAGSDLASVRTSAVKSGEGLRVDGSKLFVTNGGFAKLFTILAATPGLGESRRGHSLILLEREDRGVHTLREEKKLGLRGSSTTALALDGVEVPLLRVIGTAGHGMDELSHVLAWGRTAMAAGCMGAARAALEATLGHVNSRRQFGRALGELEVVREQLAGLGALAFAMESILEVAAASSEQELPFLSAVAKVFCSEGNWSICDAGIQLFGGSGFIEDTGMPRLLRDARVTRIFEGANDVLLGHLGGMEVAVSRPDRARSMARKVEELCGRIDEKVSELKGRMGVKLLGRARQLHRLGRAVVLREVSRAVGERAGWDNASQALANQWLDMAKERVVPLLTEPEAVEGVDRAVDALVARYGA